MFLATAVALGFGCSSHEEPPDWVAIPQPLNVSVDDCGWQSGSSLAATGGPWRLGARDPTLEDYASLSRIAQATGSRLLTLWVLSELDRSNLCARPEYNMPNAPSDMTEQGLAWDNSPHVNDGNWALMSFMRDNAAWLELGLHGVRHEHWEHGVRTRAEFGTRDGQGWGYTDSTIHLSCFAELLHQYYTQDQNPFPVSFVPPDHGYPNATASPTGAALASFGVRYGQLPGPTRFDNGVFLMDRDTSASPPWDAEGQVPGPAPSSQSWIMTHLPNYYDLEAQWVGWLLALNAPINRVAPKNSEQAASQLLYATYAHLAVNGGDLTLDTRDVPDAAYSLDLLGPIAVKVRLDGQSSVAVSSSSDLQLVAAYRDNYDHAVLMLTQPDQPRGRLTRGTFHVQLVPGQTPSSEWVDIGTSTLNVYSIARDSNGDVVADVEIYGQQTVNLMLPGFDVGAVQSDNSSVAIVNWNWDPNSARLSLTVSANNMQGDRARLIVSATPSNGDRDASN